MGEIKKYLTEIQKNIKTGKAQEQTHRPAFKEFIESFASGISAINEPRRVSCGAPDFIVTKGRLTIGYIETKDVGKSLDEIEKSEQLKRYRASLTNLILTNYLEFRRYRNGEKVESVTIADVDSSGRIKMISGNLERFNELIQNFLNSLPERIKSPKQLAVRMAQMAQMIRDLIKASFEKEKEQGTLHSQLEAFRKTLIPNLREESFADLYSQTIAYGLFAARCNKPDEKDFTREHASFLLPKTNPFLRKLFNHIAGPDLDDRIAWLVDDLAQLLASSDIGQILKDFGVRTRKEDPVVHFYETFLAEYDRKLRKSKGVYYTPEPVVSFIVRSLDYILKKEFRRPQGLSDTKTYILDPACGTGTFLYSVIKLIYDKIIEQGQKGAWDEYVAEHLLKRIFGFELLMAPYTVAHLKLGLLLQETGYKFSSDQRLGIYLTNTLSEAEHKDLPLFAQFIAEESSQAAKVKNEIPIMVILGNPPYSVSSANKNKYIERLMEDYKEDVRDERNIQPLSDDYIKFIRFAQWKIEKTGSGVIGMITNNSYLSGLIHRGMRKRLFESFNEIYILNLHGSSRVGEIAPNSLKDENVFDIQQSVAISLFIRKKNKTEPAKIYYADLWGERESKYAFLNRKDIKAVKWKELKPKPPYYFLVPKDFSLEKEYGNFWKITDIFSIWSSGVKTHRDHLVVGFTKEEIIQRIRIFISDFSDEEIRKKLKLKDTGTWGLSEARQRINGKKLECKIYPYAYRPFDMRWIYFESVLIDRGRLPFMENLLNRNIVLSLMRKPTPSHQLSQVLSVNSISDINFYAFQTYFFPLYLYPDEKQKETETKRRPNINPEFVRDISEKLKLNFIPDGQGDLKKTFGPEDVFYYIYAVFHSPAYRKRYAEFLKIDFPRVPMTSDINLFRNLVKKGKELVSLHLMESPELENLITRFPVPGKNEVVKVIYDEKSKRVYINKDQFFEGIEKDVWNFYIGGYRVLSKWLKDRKGRLLTYDEVRHYQKIVVAIRQTIRLMQEIDNLIPLWPIEFL
ncbi:MAG: N-6 DNA methylase [Elusimicrobia bacterium]|nr:N-6 DNA methylase [Elusimicrobiota bacterium]